MVTQLQSEAALIDTLDAGQQTIKLGKCLGEPCGGRDEGRGDERKRRAIDQLGAQLSLIALSGEPLAHLLDPLGANTDAVAGEHTGIVSEVQAQLARDALETVAGDGEAHLIAHRILVKHQAVIATRLDKQNIDVGVAAAQLLNMVVQSSMNKSTKDLIADPVEALVAQARAARVAAVIKGHYEAFG